MIRCKIRKVLREAIGMLDIVYLLFTAAIIIGSNNTGLRAFAIVTAFYMGFRAFADPSRLAYHRSKRLRRNGGMHTDIEWLELKRRYGFGCAYCGSKTQLTKDHVIPVSRGGTDDITNIVPACRSCNSSKGAKVIFYRSNN